MERHHNQIRKRGIIIREVHRTWCVLLRDLGFLTCVVLLVGAGIARADGAKSLIVGSVYRIGKNYVEVQTEGKGVMVVKTVSSTTYFDSSVNKPARPQDLAMGDQVAIKAVSKNGENVAEQIKFVPSIAARKTKPAAKTSMRQPMARAQLSNAL